MGSIHRRGRISREEIISAAANSFHANGYAETTLASVAGQLNVTDKAIYHYFDSKDALYLHTLEECSQRISNVLGDIDGTNRPGLTKVKHFTRAMIRRSENLRLYIRGLPNHLKGTDEGQRIRAAEHSHDEVVIQWIENGMDDGSIPPGDPKMLWKWNQGGLVWLDVWSRRDPEHRGPARFEREALAMLDRSLGCRKTSPLAPPPPLPAGGPTGAASPSTE